MLRTYMHAHKQVSLGMYVPLVLAVFGSGALLGAPGAQLTVDVTAGQAGVAAASASGGLCPLLLGEVSSLFAAARCALWGCTGHLIEVAVVLPLRTRSQKVNLNGNLWKSLTW